MPCSLAFLEWSSHASRVFRKPTRFGRALRTTMRAHLRLRLGFSRFTGVNKVNANRSADALDYTEHEKALKLLYALDRSVWDLKVNTIIESAGYETLTVNELFSKLKTTEVDNQTRAKLNGAPPSKSIALVTGPGGSSSNVTLLLAFLLPLCLLLQMSS